MSIGVDVRLVTWAYHFGLHGDLQDAGHELAPEVEQDADGGVVVVAGGKGGARQLLQVQRPQLAQHERVK